MHVNSRKVNPIICCVAEELHVTVGEHVRYTKTDFLDDSYLTTLPTKNEMNRHIKASIASVWNVERSTYRKKFYTNFFIFDVLRKKIIDPKESPRSGSGFE